MVSRMQRHLSGLRQFTNPYAPNHFIFGAQVVGDLVAHLENPLYVMGKGHNRTNAEIRLCGEAAERVSLLAPETNVRWRAHDPVSENYTDIIPRDFFGAGWKPRSHGCATHNLAKTANLLAIKELLERRTIQDWWEGNCELHLLDEKSSRFETFSQYVSEARTGALEHRETKFCELPNEHNIAVAAAISHDKDFDQIAIAFAAGANLPAVFRRAFEELITVELETSDLVRAHLDGDEIEKSSNRYLVRERQRVLKSRLTDELASCKTVTSENLQTRYYSSALELHHVLNERNQSVWLVDITHPKIGIPTTRAIFSRAEENPFLFTGEMDVLPL